MIILYGGWKSPLVSPIFKFKFTCFIFPTEVHDIIYNLYVVRFWREGGQRGIAYRAVHLIWTKTSSNTLGPSQHRRRFADDIFKCIFFNENCCILIEISLKYVRKVPIDNNPSLVQTMAWRRLGDKPISEPMMVSLPTHICVTRPQWVDWD